MKEQEQPNTPIEVEEQPNAATEHSRREFITKLVTTAGAVAAAGLVASAVGDVANADAIKIPGASTTVLKNNNVLVNKDRVAADKWNPGVSVTAKKYSPDGFRVVVSGKEVGQALQQAGLLRQGINLDNAQITIEFST
jgi:hypothetical protein